MATTKRSPFTTEEFKKTHKVLMAASQELVKLINTVDINSRDAMVVKELELLREARANIDRALTQVAHANQIHYMRKIR